MLSGCTLVRPAVAHEVLVSLFDAYAANLESGSEPIFVLTSAPMVPSVDLGEVGDAKLVDLLFPRRSQS